MPVNLAELLARLSDHRRVDERHTFIGVAREHGVVESRIHVLPTTRKSRGGQNKKAKRTESRLRRVARLTDMKRAIDVTIELQLELAK